MTESTLVCVWGLSQLRLMKDWDMWAGEGDWKVDLYEHPELEPYKEEITRVVNENVEHGCCGGCI